MRQIVLDTETTGLRPEEGHRIVEIAAVELENRRLTGRHFHYYINPQRNMDPEAQKIHGITTEFLADKPIFADVMHEFIAFVEGAELIIHNAPFDVGFINHEFTLTKQSVKKIDQYCQVIDTLAMARLLHPGQRNSLDAVCKRYDVDNSKRDLHGALVDADLLALAYLAMTSGQENLFSEQEKSKQTQAEQIVEAAAETVITTGNLKVILADETELTKHQQRLAAIQQQAKKCIWQE